MVFSHGTHRSAAGAILLRLAILCLAMLATTATAFAAHAPAPKVTSAVFATGATAGSPATLIVKALDRDGAIVSIEIAWGDGSVTRATRGCSKRRRGASTRFVVDHVYAAAGTYDTTVVARSSTCRSNASIQKSKSRSVSTMVSAPSTV